MDNDYPNAGDDWTDSKEVQYFDQPIERTEEEASKAAVLNASYPVMQSVIAWFDTAIMDCDRMSNIDLNHAKLSAAEQVHAWQQVKMILESKASEFDKYRSEQ